MKRNLILVIIVFVIESANAQDPHYSQFFMAPQLLNPANSGAGQGDWRILTNYRQQWANAGTPFTTMSIGADAKLVGKDEGENVLGIGIIAMSDQSMNGAFKSVYGGLGLAYHVHLTEEHKLGLGLQATYGNRRLDYSQLTFGEQFTSGGFDVTLPSGETTISNMRPFISVAAGLLYNYSTEFLHIDVGAAGFHLNKPKQSFTGDEQQIIPIRYSGHINLAYQASAKLLLNFNGIYQQQSTQQYFSIGGAMGLDVSNGDKRAIIYGGGWWRQRDAFYPYLALLFGPVQVGFSYDITHSKQTKSAAIPRSAEISIVIRQMSKLPGIPCPTL